VETAPDLPGAPGSRPVPWRASAQGECRSGRRNQSSKRRIRMSGIVGNVCVPAISAPIKKGGPRAAFFGGEVIRAFRSRRNKDPHSTNPFLPAAIISRMRTNFSNALIGQYICCEAPFVAARLFPASPCPTDRRSQRHHYYNSLNIQRQFQCPDHAAFLKAAPRGTQISRRSG